MKKPDAKSALIVANQEKYEDIYSKIIVTYPDNTTKEFTTDEFAIFEEGIRKMNNLKIEYISKDSIEGIIHTLHTPKQKFTRKLKMHWFFRIFNKIFN